MVILEPEGWGLMTSLRLLSFFSEQEVHIFFSLLLIYFRHVHFTYLPFKKATFLSKRHEHGAELRDDEEEKNK